MSLIWILASNGCKIIGNIAANGDSYSIIAASEVGAYGLSSSAKPN